MTLNRTELKTSTVLQAMVTGLLKSKDDRNFTVDMSTFGTVENQLCYGCCATVALAEMFGRGRSVSEIMLKYREEFHPEADRPTSAYAYLSSYLQLELSSAQDSLPIDIKSLEDAINSARLGDVSELIAFLTSEVNKSFDDRWILCTENWEEQLSNVKATIAEMIAAGY